MRFDRKSLTLYAVTDRAWTNGRSLSGDVEAALRGGVTLVQLREKELDRDSFLAEASELVPLCHAYGVPLIINDNVEIAQLSGADGVHVGQSDGDPRTIRQLTGRDFIIGVSARTVGEAASAEAAGADYIGVGAMFPTSTKTNTRRLTPGELLKITSSVAIPAVAIGGVNGSNMRTLAGTGVAGFAVVSAIFAAGDRDGIEAAARGLRGLSETVTGTAL